MKEAFKREFHFGKAGQLLIETCDLHEEEKFKDLNQREKRRGKDVNE